MQEQKAPTKAKVKVFKLLLDTYVYSATLGTFVKLPNMPPQLPAQLFSAAKALQEIEQGKFNLNYPVCLAVLVLLCRFLVLLQCLGSCLLVWAYSMLQR